LELSAAIVAAERHPAMLPLVTRDEPLTQDAEREGSPAMRPTQAPLISSSRLLPRQPNPRRTTILWVKPAGNTNVMVMAPTCGAPQEARVRVIVALGAFACPPLR
jgi:hypothetical protein